MTILHSHESQLLNSGRNHSLRMVPQETQDRTWETGPSNQASAAAPCDLGLQSLWTSAGGRRTEAALALSSLFHGAQRGTRTPTALRPTYFKSAAREDKQLRNKKALRMRCASRSVRLLLFLRNRNFPHRSANRANQSSTMGAAREKQGKQRHTGSADHAEPQHLDSREIASARFWIFL